MIKYILFLLITIPIMIFSQNTQMRMDEALRELELEELSLLFTDALTGKSIPDALVQIKGIGKFSTDTHGYVYFQIPEVDGYYSVTFQKKGYITSTFDIETVVGSIFFNRFSVSPKMPIEYIRIVVDWGETPSDLDAHLVKKNNYHISYRNKKVSDDREANLDRDDTNSFGPETITINKVDENAEYSYFIHDYTNRNKGRSTKLSDSKACVKVYGEGDKLLKKYEIPRGSNGIFWKVFKIKNGEIESRSQLTSENY